jgi:Asp-tRNA(Asn)/Glu-tRNA(Gln) amidotransferase C subunit
MEEVLKKNTSKKYDFSNKESQKLFEEFTLLLADITKYVESQDERILLKGEELNQVQSNYEKTREELVELQNKQKELLSKLELTNSGKYMVKALAKKSIYRVNKGLGDVPRKVVNKLKNLFK